METAEHTPKAGNPFIPVFFYAPILALFIGWNIVAGTFGRREWPLWVAGGFFLWTLIEYLMHRFIFHYPFLSPKLQEVQAGLHLRHHERPYNPDEIVARPSFSLPIATGIWLALRPAVGSWEIASLVISAVILGYLFYEAVHYSLHTRRGGGPLLRFWRRYHFAHHFKNAGRCYGVTSPLWDFVFRTTLPKS